MPLVARLFSAARPNAAAEADVDVLRYLAEIGFPAERPFGIAALTSHEGQALLATEFIKGGATIGRLHGLAVPAGALRPAGALHHFAEGTMVDELRATADWLDSIEALVPNEDGDALAAIRAAVAAADGGHGVPERFAHPTLFPRM
jgi:hypothetical protein